MRSFGPKRLRRSSSQTFSASKFGKAGAICHKCRVANMPLADGAHRGRSFQPDRSPNLQPDCRTRLKDVVACHGQKAHGHIALLAAANPVHRCLHVIVDAPVRDAVKHTESIPMAIKQHLLTPLTHAAHVLSGKGQCISAGDVTRGTCVCSR